MALTAEAKQRLIRLRDDRLHYFERALKIRTKDSRLVPFRPNPIQLQLNAVVEEFKRKHLPVRIIGLKARQQGFSTYCQGYIFQDTAMHPYRNSLTIAHEDDSTTTLFEMGRLMYEELPLAIRPMKRYSNKSGELVFDNANEAERKEKPGLRSSLRVATAGNKEAGRSKMAHNLHASELAFWPDPKKTLTAILQTIPDLPDTAVFLESTANGLGGEFYERYQMAKRGENAYTALFFAWFDNPEYQTPGTSAEDRELEADLGDEETQLRDKHGLSLAQLRWRRRKIGDLNGDVDQFRQEYPANDVEAFIVPGNCFFDVGIVRKLFLVADHGLYGEIDGDGFHAQTGGRLEVWEPPEPGEAYVVAGDVAEGIEGGDYSCLQVLRRSDLVQVAEWHGHIDADDFGRVGVRLARWYNGAWLGIESNNHGLTSLKAAAATGYRNLYHRQLGHDQEREEHPGERLGWQTNKQTRPVMLDGMKAALREGSSRPNGPDLLKECTTFVRKPNGKPEGAEGTNDDRVMAYAIGLKLHELCPMPRRKPIKEPDYTPRSSRTGY